MHVRQPGKIVIEDGHAADSIARVRKLFQEYASWLGKDELCFQGFKEELATLPGLYAPPGGAIRLVWVDNQPAGCVAMRPLETGICEMKRLWVVETYRSLGLGKRLVDDIISRAREAGYERMRLDTLNRMQNARATYYARGFREIPPYYASPMIDVVYLEKVL